jgi:hypothetical protein
MMDCELPELAIFARGLIGQSTSASPPIVLQNSLSLAVAMSASTRSGHFFFPLSADADAGLVLFGL